MNTKISSSCQTCILCGSGQVERRQRVVTDLLRMRSAKYQCHCCNGILYRKNRFAALFSKSRHQSKPITQP